MLPTANKKLILLLDSHCTKNEIHSPLGSSRERQYHRKNKNLTIFTSFSFFLDTINSSMTHTEYQE